MSQYIPDVPPANGGVVLYSQDTFAAPGVSVGGISGGSGPSPGGVQSTIANTGDFITLDGRGVVSISSIGFVNISTTNGFSATANNVDILANVGQMNLTSIGNLQLNSGAGDASLAAGDITVNLSGTGGPMAIVAPGGVTIASTLSVLALTGVSSLNGQIPNSGGGSIPPNLSVSTLTCATSLTTGAGAPINCGGQILSDGVITASLGMVVGEGGISILKYGANENVSNPINFFSGTVTTPSTGILSIRKWLWPNEAGQIVPGLGVLANSTVTNSFQPLCCGDMYVNNSDSTGAGTGVVRYVDAVSSMSLAAAGGNVSISTASMSSINGTSWDALVSTVVGLNGGPI